MSFFEDNVEDGSHCASCCQYIGEGNGFIRYCKDCDPSSKTPKKVNSNGQTKTQKRNAQRVRANIRKREAKEAEISKSGA